MADIHVVGSDEIDWAGLLSRFETPTGNFTVTIGDKTTKVGSCLCVTEQERLELISILKERVDAVGGSPK